MNKPIRWLFVINIVLVTVWGMCKFYYSHKKSELMTSQNHAYAVQLERAGILREAETERRIAILDRFSHSHTLTDDDFGWEVSTIQSSASRGVAGAVARCMILSEWRAVKHWPPSQHEKAFQVLSSLANDQDDNVRVIAMQVLANTKDPRAISCLLPLLDSPKPAVKRDAQKYLTKMGYKS